MPEQVGVLKSDEGITRVQTSGFFQIALRAVQIIDAQPYGGAHAQELGLVDRRLPYSAYQNTIGVERQGIYPGDLELEERATRSMETLERGDCGVFVRVSDSDPEMLRYLASCGISPGERFEVRDHQPFGGPLFVLFGEREHAIGGRLAGAMRVELEPAPLSGASPSGESADGGD